uniref:Uncharacterized protein n=1 Tax=viral metagenome TaxID=1070528 RepID=A0A6H1ZFS8_9ZZZZ
MKNIFLQLLILAGVYPVYLMYKFGYYNGFVCWILEMGLWYAFCWSIIKLAKDES